jgi:hypothetical protein
MPDSLAAVSNASNSAYMKATDRRVFALIFDSGATIRINSSNSCRVTVVVQGLSRWVDAFAGQAPWTVRTTAVGGKVSSGLWTALLGLVPDGDPLPLRQDSCAVRMDRAFAV